MVVITALAVTGRYCRKVTRGATTCGVRPEGRGGFRLAGEWPAPGHRAKMRPAAGIAGTAGQPRDGPRTVGEGNGSRPFLAGLRARLSPDNWRTGNIAAGIAMTGPSLGVGY